MDPKELSERISSLIATSNFDDAEKLLVEAKQKADAEGNRQLSHFALSELIELYCLHDPPLWVKAEALSNERERLNVSAYAILQTAIILHRGIHDYTRAIVKLEAAIARGNEEHDEKTIYTSLSLLGQAALELGQKEKALAALAAIEIMVDEKRSIVVGDETVFLENLRTRQLETERVVRLASLLAPVCRDVAFKHRLNELATLSTK